MKSRYERWQEATRSVEGFFAPEAAAAWDFLLEMQEERLSGALGEIGVYHGKSAALLALHTGEAEQLYLVDTADRPETGFLRQLVPEQRITTLVSRSSELPALGGQIRHVRKLRWIHIDGEHTGEAVVNDLRLAELALHDEGIICLDDFFSPMYPQITAAAFEFLSTHRHQLTLFLCGHNKGYLCRPMAAPAYLKRIRAAFVSALAARGIRNVTVFRTTTASDMSCFGVGPRWKDYDYYGLDANPADVPV